MYSTESNIVFSFNDCERELAERIVNNPSETLHYSEHPYNWLGKGMCFWENDLDRVLEWAKISSKVTNPAVLGTAISLDNCLDFMPSKNIDARKKLHDSYLEIGCKIPENKNISNGNFEFKLCFAGCLFLD